MIKQSQDPTGKGSNRESRDSFRIEVKNSSPEATPALMLYYTLTRRSTGDPITGLESVREPLSGSLGIPSIPAFRAETVETHLVKVARVTDIDTRLTTNSGGKQVEVSTTRKGEVILKGINFVVYLNNREVAKWNTGGLQDQTVDLKAAGFIAPAGANDDRKPPGMHPFPDN